MVDDGPGTASTRSTHAVIVSSAPLSVQPVGPAEAAFLAGTAQATIDTARPVTLDPAALDEFRLVNHRWGIGASLGRMGHARLDAGDLSAAAGDFLACLDWGDENAMPSIVWYGLVGIGMTLGQAGDDERSAVLLAHNASIAQNQYTEPLGKPAFRAVGARLSAAELESAESRGQAMEMVDAIMFARRCAEELIGTGTRSPAIRTDEDTAVRAPAGRDGRPTLRS